MEWLTKMNAAIDYIETHLTEDIHFDIVAMNAGCSSYNFQRMFSFITDIPLAEYIRRRRLTQAALELQNTDQKVIDVAIKYGYDSATSFTRAFKTLHGLTPTEARQEGVILKAYPKISFQISIKGDQEMNYRIETKEAFDVFGIETICSLTNEEGRLTPAQLWKQCQQNGEYERLYANSGKLPDYVAKNLCKIHGVENYRTTDDNTFAYMLCAFCSKDSKTKGYQIAHIPAQTYAIFPSETFHWDEDFHTVLTTLQKRFYTEWLPTADYNRADGPNFEIYGGTPESGYIELWYPIVRK
ncbi:AraC family transcriptional regulator [Anaerosporobacter faecicola]|uniref:AraC family transcriptional regulator n=1 Tax=Anaerosporobacter faecicola TaxID=2718714 RepID=UPI00143BA6DB|nr:AraC family transcriptional regulator [Anaerosporobacter faecicola]